MQIEPQPTERMKRLRDKTTKRKPSITHERDELLTEAYKEFSGCPIEILRAKSLKKILEGISISIEDDELIVGNQACSTHKKVGLFLEYSSSWIEKEINIFSSREHDPMDIEDKTKQKILSLLPYWEGKTVKDYAFSLIPEETRKAYESNIFAVDLHLFSGLGHVALGFDKVLNLGFKGIKEEIAEKRGDLNYSSVSDLKKIYELKAFDISCDAAINFANRYASLAREKAADTKKARRKQELLEIAKVCKNVPANPAKNFHEALQSLYFCQLISQIESDGTAISPGRVDYFTFPYYRNDINKGAISQQKAQELIDCLFIKLQEILKVWNAEDAKFFAGFPISQNLCAGGLDENGKDTTNEVSYMLIQSMVNLQLPRPAFSVRLHANSPEKFINYVCEAVKLGTGMPAIFNDEAIIPALMNRGISLEEARKYALVGCVEPSIQGSDWPRSNGGFLNFAKVLELALNNGVCRLTEEQLGLETGEPSNFESFNDVMQAYFTQFDYFLKHMVIMNNIIDIAHADKAPLPFVSSIMNDCISECRDVTRGGARYNTTGPLAVGLANVADSLAAIKKLVYDDKILNMDSLIKSLNTNFRESENIRQTLINKAPKYGNDNDYVDMIARKIALYYCKNIKKYKNGAQSPFSAAFVPVSSNVPLGKFVGATPDGRKAKKPLAEGVSPVQGRDYKGPTAVINSVSKLDQENVSVGVLFNQKFTPKLLEGNKGTKNLGALIKTYFQKKGQHIQINVISSEQLKDAQKNPEKYKNLIVRVAGYSAFFNDLDRTVQDDIINRTEQKCF